MVVVLKTAVDVQRVAVNRGFESLPLYIFFEAYMTEEELEIVINHLIDSKNGGLTDFILSLSLSMVC